ncbi:MAG: site-2 protease family protein, partial [Verrucomicrobia bacterium]
MGWSFKIGRVADTEIRIHGTFLMLFAWYALIAYQSGGAKSMFEGSLFVLLLFTCVVLHELGHATAAKRYGIRTPDITLLPIGG